MGKPVKGDIFVLAKFGSCQLPNFGRHCLPNWKGIKSKRVIAGKEAL